MKLNLRDLFWLIFVAAVVTMWWMDRSKLADRLSFYEPKRTIIQTGNSSPQTGFAGFVIPKDSGSALRLRVYQEP